VGEKPIDKWTRLLIVEELRLSLHAIRGELAEVYHPDRHPQEVETYAVAMGAVNRFSEEIEKAIEKLLQTSCRVGPPETDIGGT
jgi:hypothetical protein